MVKIVVWTALVHKAITPKEALNIVCHNVSYYILKYAVILDSMTLLHLLLFYIVPMHFNF